MVFHLYHYLHRLSYNTDTNRYSDASGVTISVPGFGSTSTVETLNFNLIRASYLNTFVEYFVKRGYIRDTSIRAAPYDWRLAAGKIFHVYLPLMLFVYTMHLQKNLNEGIITLL